MVNIIGTTVVDSVRRWPKRYAAHDCSLEWYRILYMLVYCMSFSARAVCKSHLSLFSWFGYVIFSSRITLTISMF